MLSRCVSSMSLAVAVATRTAGTSIPEGCRVARSRSSLCTGGLQHARATESVNPVLALIALQRVLTRRHHPEAHVAHARSCGNLHYTLLLSVSLSSKLERNIVHDSCPYILRTPKHFSVYTGCTGACRLFSGGASFFYFKCSFQNKKTK